MDASSSSSTATAIATTVAVESTAAVLLRRIAVDRGKEKNHDDEIILQTVIVKCHTAIKIDHIRIVPAQFHPIKTMNQPPCFDIEY